MTTPNLPIVEAVNYPTEAVSPKLYSSAPVYRQVSLRGRGKVGVRILDNSGTPVNADEIRLEIYEDGELLETVSLVTHEREGEYSYLLEGELTESKRALLLKWVYWCNGTNLTFEEKVLVVEPMPLFETFTEEEKSIVEQVSWLFADLSDSTIGGAHLTETFQAHFNYERLAQLAVHALNKINIFKQPITDFYVGQGTGIKGRLPQKYHSLLIMATYLEVLRHLSRSYVEIPEFRNMSTTYTDRRDYMQRWRQILDEEKPQLEEGITLMKRELMNLGRGALVVAGGIYGRGTRGGLFQYGMYSSQVRSTRFYPAIPSMSSYPRS